jgi:PAS domain S-box-containing protein
VAGEVEAKVARVDERAAGVERQAERAEAAVTAAERHVTRATEAAGSADRHAARAGEQAGAVEETARRLAEAAAAAERQAEHAREAAAEAEKAAGAARQAADEAGVSAHRSGEDLRVISRFESFAASAAHPPQTGQARPAPALAPAPAAGNGAPPPAAEAPAALAPRKPLFEKKDTGPEREPRPGFDDAKQPKATIGLDGRFRELNQAFTDLVGYSESEFHQAVWPPVMDRANLDKHREQMKDMLAGKIESADIKTGYVHAQGLLVPVVGTLTLVRENGEPSHFLLETS